MKLYPLHNSCFLRLELILNLFDVTRGACLMFPLNFGTCHSVGAGGLFAPPRRLPNYLKWKRLQIILFPYESIMTRYVTLLPSGQCNCRFWVTRYVVCSLLLFWCMIKKGPSVDWDVPSNPTCTGNCFGMGMDFLGGSCASGRRRWQA